jgi:hypothetical protein
MSLARAIRVVCALLALTSLPHFACADDKPHWVAHGADITPAKVGPAAVGYTKLKPFAGGQINQKNDYPFGTWIDRATSYDGFDVPAGHLLIEGVAFTSSLDISAPFPVVLRGVSVRLSQASPWAILMRPTSGGLYVLWSEAGGSEDMTAFPKPIDVALDLRGAPAAVYHSRFSRALDGLHISGSKTRVEQNLIDDLLAFPESHNDGIQLLGRPHDVTIHKNRITNRHPQTSCINLLGTRLKVSSNYLAGGGWTLYGGANNNGHGGEAGGPVTVSDNIFGRDVFAKSGHFGPVAYWDKSDSSRGIWENNRFSDGAAVMP